MNDKKSLCDFRSSDLVISVPNKKTSESFDREKIWSP